MLNLNSLLSQKKLDQINLYLSSKSKKQVVSEISSIVENKELLLSDAKTLDLFLTLLNRLLIREQLKGNTQTIDSATSDKVKALISEHDLRYG